MLVVFFQLWLMLQKRTFHGLGKHMNFGRSWYLAVCKYSCATWLLYRKELLPIQKWLSHLGALHFLWSCYPTKWFALQGTSFPCVFRVFMSRPRYYHETISDKRLVNFLKNSITKIPSKLLDPVRCFGSSWTQFWYPKIFKIGVSPTVIMSRNYVLLQFSIRRLVRT